VCVCVPRAAEVWLACVRDSSRRAVQKEKAAQQQQQQSEAGERRTRQNTPEHANIAQHSGVWWRRRAWAWGWGLFFFFFGPVLPFLAIEQYCGVIQAQPQS
jgi:hypothetical protein